MRIGIDVGAAELIISGAISVKSGVEISHFEDNGGTIVFSDESVLDVGVIIFAYVMFFLPTTEFD